MTRNLKYFLKEGNQETHYTETPSGRSHCFNGMDGTRAANLLAACSPALWLHSGDKGIKRTLFIYYLYKPKWFSKRSLKHNIQYLNEFEFECSWSWRSEGKVSSSLSSSSSSSSLSRLSSESYSALLWEGGSKGWKKNYIHYHPHIWCDAFKHIIHHPICGHFTVRKVPIIYHSISSI